MSARKTPRAIFRLGRIMVTPNARLQLTTEEILAALQRHQGGDWGEVLEPDRVANEYALIEGKRLWSVYRSATHVKFRVITEADRSITTVLMPEDY